MPSSWPPIPTPSRRSKPCSTLQGRCRHRRSLPVEHPKIEEWEACCPPCVCTTLLYAAQSFGYAVQWLTEWYAYNERMLTALGGTPGHDRIAGSSISARRSSR